MAPSKDPSPERQTPDDAVDLAQVRTTPSVAVAEAEIVTELLPSPNALFDPPLVHMPAFPCLTSPALCAKSLPIVLPLSIPLPRPDRSD